MRALLLALLLGGCTLARPAFLPPAPPGLTTAWVTFDAARDRAAGRWGLADRAAGRLVGPDDPVRVASVSKLVVALGVMRLVEAGTLDLDEDVSVKLGWRLRNPAHPEVPITLRLLLSHRSSLTDDADYLIPLGQTLRARFDDLRAFDRARRPGTWWRYSNLNYPVIATVVERATGERFDRAMAHTILQPLGLDACFNWDGCSDRAAARAVVLYAVDGSVRNDDLKGRKPGCPVFVAPGTSCDLASYRPGTNGGLFSPQGGLRISMRGLAVVGRLLLNRGVHDGRRLLSATSIDAVLTPAWRFDGGNGANEAGFYCGYGLGSQSLPTAAPGCDDRLFGDRAMTGHAGEAYGVRSGLWIDRRTRTGIAYFAANTPVEAERGRSAYTAVEEALAGRLTR